MKKFWLSLGLTVMLACWCGEETTVWEPVQLIGQDFYAPSLSCNPSDPACYGDYYRAPYADPRSQYLYYSTPSVDRDYRYQRREANRERRAREREYRRGY